MVWGDRWAPIRRGDLLQDAIPEIRPSGYNPLRHPVSSLEIGPFGWIQVANFIVSGLLLLAFAVGLWTALRRCNGGFYGPLLVGLFGLGLIGDGLFATDAFNGFPPGTPAVPGARTIHGLVHQAFSALVFLGPPAACCVLGYKFARSGRQWWARCSIGTAVIFLIGFVLANMAFEQNPTLVSIGGLLEGLTLITGVDHRSGTGPLASAINVG